MVVAVAESLAPTRAVDRALGLLSATVDAPSTLTELARGAELAPSTASRLLGALQRRGLVRRGEDGRFRSGPELVRLAAATLRAEPAYVLADPHLAALTQATGETANLGVAGADGVVYLRQSASPRTVRAESWVGRTVPLQGTAIGAAVRGEVGAGGFVVAAAAVEPDVTAIAAPFRDHRGEIAGALSVTAPTYRTSDDDAAAYGRAVVQHANELSRELGAA
jgi:DNA-binding IclR family transcriptional regulator